MEPLKICGWTAAERAKLSPEMRERIRAQAKRERDPGIQLRQSTMFRLAARAVGVRWDDSRDTRRKISDAVLAKRVVDDAAYERAVAIWEKLEWDFGCYKGGESGLDGTMAALASGTRQARYEDIRPAERARMRREDPDRFAALRTDWTKRGQPHNPGPPEAA